MFSYIAVIKDETSPAFMKVRDALKWAGGREAESGIYDVVIIIFKDMNAIYAAEMTTDGRGMFCFQNPKNGKYKFYENETEAARDLAEIIARATRQWNELQMNELEERWAV